MPKLTKPTVAFLGASLLLFSGPHPISAETRRIELNFKNQTLSAKIKDAPLGSVIKKIEEQKGVWFKLWLKGKESLLEEKVSVKFKDIPVQQALDRILYKTNHGLVFDKQGNLLGVVLLLVSRVRDYMGAGGES